MTSIEGKHLRSANLVRTSWNAKKIAEDRHRTNRNLVKKSGKNKTTFIIYDLVDYSKVGFFFIKLVFLVANFCLLSFFFFLEMYLSL